ncbi:MAG: gluconeogenesis factor YvcK family protein [Thermodesulfobacteriota bacterium]
MTGNGRKGCDLQGALRQVFAGSIGPLDLLPYNSLVEKMVHLVLEGVPAVPAGAGADLERLRASIENRAADSVRVVVLGGGTGLSNVIGGDSRRDDWPAAPFQGLKKIFPATVSVVCVTDDGGSTGELLKDLPLIGIGDLRHVLLSSVQERRLAHRYGLGWEESFRVVDTLHRLFNYRFMAPPESVEAIAAAIAGFDRLPEGLREGLYRLLVVLFTEKELRGLWRRNHCLGNLLLAAAIHLSCPWGCLGPGREIPPEAVTGGIRLLCSLLGTADNAVLPCTTTPARLKILYANGVLASGEYKSSLARRNCPVDRVFVEYAAEPRVPDGVIAAIREADLVVMAPGSLYTSLIPVLQLAEIAEAIRANRQAVKVLVANLWVQKGETDLVGDDPQRRFHVSDLVKSYQRNIPGGVAGLFDKIMAVSLRNIPGSVLQNYAIEGKVPIYLDREELIGMGFVPVEARIFSENQLAGRGALQHDPASLARALHTIWALREYFPADIRGRLPEEAPFQPPAAGVALLPCERHAVFREHTARICGDAGIANRLLDICWFHQDILAEHLDRVDAIRIVAEESWSRCQKWDNIFSFYEPESRAIVIRSDVAIDSNRFEIGFLIALGQSLLGDYAARKELQPVTVGDHERGKIYLLELRPEGERNCFFTAAELRRYLHLARMNDADGEPLLFTRLINAGEGFTPPGLLFGMMYAWYLDNRFTAYMEYKMAIARNRVSDLIPEQQRTACRRREMIDFFRTVVFRQNILPGA